MKIAFLNRNDCLKNRGGDTVQMLLTKKYLEAKYPVNINICLSENELDSSYDLVHIFNIQNSEESYKYIKKAKELGIKTAVSTIYWDLDHLRILKLHYLLFKSEKYLNNKFVNFCFKRVCSFIKKMRSSNKEQILLTKKIIEEADYLLPNSDEELKCVANDFLLNYEELNKKSTSIPNAVDYKNRISNVESQTNLDIKNYVLMVGRIEENKNQLSVVKALKNTPEIPIVIIGRFVHNKNADIYCNELKELAKERGNVYFISEVSHDEIDAYYMNAAVHVLASFRESPGLVSLEALKNKCEIVVSNEMFCPVNFYKFNQYGHICNPYDTNSIRNAIFDALKNKKNNADNSYFNFYSYENAAKMTYESYLKMLGEM